MRQRLNATTAAQKQKTADLGSLTFRNVDHAT